VSAEIASKPSRNQKRDKGKSSLRRRTDSKITEEVLAICASASGRLHRVTADPWCYEANARQTSAITRATHSGDDNPLWCDPDSPRNPNLAASSRCRAPVLDSRSVSGYVGGARRPRQVVVARRLRCSWHRTPVKRTDVIRPRQAEGWSSIRRALRGVRSADLYHVDFFNQQGDLVAEADYAGASERARFTQQGAGYQITRGSRPARRAIYSEQGTGRGPTTLYCRGRRFRSRSANGRTSPRVSAARHVQGGVERSRVHRLCAGLGRPLNPRQQVAEAEGMPIGGLAIPKRCGITDVPSALHWGKDVRRFESARRRLEEGKERCSWLDHHITNGSRRWTAVAPATWQDPPAPSEGDMAVISRARFKRQIRRENGRHLVRDRAGKPTTRT